MLPIASTVAIAEAVDAAGNECVGAELVARDRKRGAQVGARFRTAERRATSDDGTMSTPRAAKPSAT